MFKAQIQLLQELLAHFVGKGEIDLRECLGFDDLLQANAFSMFDQYAQLFFDVELDRDERPYSSKQCPMKIVSEEYMIKNDSFYDRDKISESNENSDQCDSRVRAANWLNYTHGCIHLPKQYTETTAKLEHLMQSPLMPANLLKYIEEYLKLVQENVTEIELVLTLAAKEMPSKYTTYEQLKQSSMVWVHNLYNDHFRHLEPVAAKIVNAVREYYCPDKLLDG